MKRLLRVHTRGAGWAGEEFDKLLSSCRILPPNHVTTASDVQVANGWGCHTLAYSRFYVEGDYCTVCCVEGVRGSRGVRELSCDLRDVRGQLEHLRDQLDHIIDSLDSGPHPSRSEHGVSPMGVVTMGLKPSPKGKVLSDALESKSMGQLKDARLKGKGLCEPLVRPQIRPKVKPTLSGR